MKKSEIKKVLKPIVEELVEEVIGEILLTEGFLESKIKDAIYEGNIIKGVVSQVASGLVESNATTNTNNQNYQQKHSYTRVDYDSPTPAAREFSLTENDFALKSQLNNTIVNKLRNNKKIGIMFEGTNPLNSSGESAVLDNGEPNYQDPLSIAASIPNPELGGEVSQDVIFSLLGGKRYKF